MDYKNLWECVQRAVHSLTASWGIKMTLAAVFAAIQLHIELFLVFNLLVILDCATKWIALARPLCQGPPEVWEEIKMIPEAHRRGIIQSEKMKTRFIGKIAVYLIATIAAAAVDIALGDIGRNPQAVSLCVGYLAATELLSIVENLNDAGVSAMADLLAIVKKVRNK